MPFFDYKCKVCNKEFQELVKKHDDKVFCPDCKGEAEKIYYGKVVGSMGAKSSSCSGNCKNCSGCK